MPIKYPIVAEIAKDLFIVNEFGLDCMFIICGREKALVVDTGMGYCDFKSIIEQITSLPYTVVLTHGHIDHAGGWGQFDEVYIHPLDIELAKSIDFERKVEDGEHLRGMWGDADVWEYSRESVRKWETFPKTFDLYDGKTFDLGNRKITTLYSPGHTIGSCSFIDHQTRTLLSGDACNTNTGISCYISTTLKGLLNIKKHEDEFDRNCNGHLGYASDITCLSLPETVLDDCIGACKSVLDGTAEVFTWKSHLGNNWHRTATIFGSSRINYLPDKIMAPGDSMADFEF